MRLRLRFTRASLSFLPLLVAACGGSGSPTDDPPESDPDSGYFESSSSNPTRGPGAPSAAGDAAGVPGADGANPGANPGGENDAGREIAEADIIQLEGTRLYAMSRTGGLSVIDMSNPSELKILGRYRTSFTPFEMYIRGGVVFAMYSDWGEFVPDEDAEGHTVWVWKQTSTLLALDVNDPARIQKIGQFDLAGEISDSRLVGNVLYAVSYQNGSCWGCATKPATNVVSIDVTVPNAPSKVDELEFADEGSQYGWGKRSIAVTEERIYVAGPEYGYEQPENSTIQVIDISDPGGDLVAGTTVKVRGQINNRWQMDEYAGTLRVISQPWTWWNNTVSPSLETFSVASSQEIQKLAQLNVVLPRPESLQSVRFDGERAYAVTFERTDPLFTFDLSDPTAPVQRGELEMPGFLYHMVPRGDRLIGLGYDQNNADGAVTVSVFDVTDLAKPTMLERVNFGGQWAQLPEDQDRIHKAFKLDEDNGLILVPFSGWKPAEGTDWCSQSLNGVQLIDWAGDDLALRGMTHSLGQARRAFIADGSLFTVAEQEVGAYDISNRDAPKELGIAPLALNVSLTLPAGDELVRLRQDWYSDDMRLEVVPKSAAEALVAAKTFNLTDYLRKEHGLAGCNYWYPVNEPLFMTGDTVWTLINDYGEWNEERGYAKSRALLIGFSPATGEVVSSLELPFRSGYWGWGNTSRVVRGDVVYLMQEGWDEDSSLRSLIALDLSDATQPRVARRVDLPTTRFYGATGLLESGDELVTSYARSVAGKEGVVRHFLVRVDISSPLAPRLLGDHNIPGYLVDYDAQSAAAVTMDHAPLSVEGRSWEECDRALPNSWYDQGAGLCRSYSATLHRIRIVDDKVSIVRSLRKDELLWSTPRRGDGRLFFTSGYGYVYGDIAVGPIASDGIYGGWSWASQDVTVLDSETFAHSTVEAPGVWNVLPLGQSLLLAPSAGQPLTVIDGKDPEKPALRSTEDTALGQTQHLSVSGSDVYLSQGAGGVQRMTLP